MRSLFRKKIVQSIASILVLLLVMVCLTGVSFSQVSRATWEQLSWEVEFDDFDEDRIQDVQMDLLLLGYDPGGVDGIIGPRTRVALIQFCVDFSVEPRSGFANYLTDTIHLAATRYRESLPASATRSARSVFQNIGNGLDLYQNGDLRRKERGRWEQLSWAIVFENFSEDQIREVQRNLFSLGYDPGEVDGKIGSRTRPALVQFCVDFRIEPRGDFANYLATVLFRESFNVVVTPMHPHWKRILLSEAFDKWVQGQPQFLNLSEGFGTAQEVIKILKEFKKSRQDDITSVEEIHVVTSVVQDIQKRLDLYQIGDAERRMAEKRPENRKTDEFGVSFQLTESDLKELRVEPEIVAQLQVLADQKFESEDELKTAVEGIVKGSVDEITEDRLKSYVSFIVNVYTERPTKYTLAEHAFDEMTRDDILNADIIEQLKKDGDLYNSIAQLKMDVGRILKGIYDDRRSNGYVKYIVDKAQAVTVYTLTERSFHDLKKEYQAIPYSIRDSLDCIKGAEFVNQSLFENALVASFLRVLKIPDQPVSIDMLRTANTWVEDYRIRILKKARKEHTFFGSKINWSGGSYGGVLDFPDIVYGFYPFWMAGRTQTVNFSVVKRIGYFAVPLDNIRNGGSRFHWAAYLTDFINVAREYNTRVDLVVYNDDWKAWTDKLNMADTIAGLLEYSDIEQDPLKDTINRMLHSISSSRLPFPTRGDGITLYFDFDDLGGVDTAGLSKKYSVFINTLRREVKFAGRDTSNWTEADFQKSRKLNLLLPMDDLGEGVYSWEKLRAIKQDIDLFLVILEEPTTDAKKLLRTIVEMHFHGEDRKDMLRKIIPVIRTGRYIVEDPGRLHQFQDDVIYFEDNFDGIGLWPLPVGEDQESVTVANSLNKRIVNFLLTPIEQGTAYVTLWTSSIWSVDALSLRLQNFDTLYYGPYRWAYVFALLLAGSIFLIYYVLSFWVFELGVFFQAHPWVRLFFFIPAGLLLLIFLLVDPITQNLGNWKFVLVVVLVLVSLVVQREKSKQEAHFP